MSNNSVSPCRDMTCAQPTHDKAITPAGSHGLNAFPGVTASAKATAQRVPKADPEGTMPHPVAPTEKVSAGRPERPAIPDPRDIFIEACVTARERGITRVECKMLLHDAYNAPWSQS